MTILDDALSSSLPCLDPTPPTLPPRGVERGAPVPPERGAPVPPEPTPEPRALILEGHAEVTSFNAALAESYAQGWEAAGGVVERVQLSALRFDLVLRAGFRDEQPLEPDLVALRDAIERARHVAWVFPTYWASPPALVRGVVDRLFTPGWAFRYEGGALPLGLLRGRSARVITTMDSPSWWYTLAHRRAIHATMGTATLRFTGFSPVRFTTLYGVRDLGERARSEWLRKVRANGLADARKAGAAPRRPGYVGPSSVEPEGATATAS